MSGRHSKYPKCFGQLETVFPMGEDGLRHTPTKCFACQDKTECLRAAVEGHEGLKVREERIDRAYDAGMMGFLERWSRKKSIQQLKRVKKKN
jgi:hypothetical protein